MPQPERREADRAAGNNASPLSDFLARVADEARAVIDASHIGVAVAHPDDETIGCGALLARLKGVHLIVVTDGAPRDLRDARRYGFATANDYASARHAELTQCLRLTGITAGNLLELSIPDQQAAAHLFEVTLRLAESFASRRTHIVLTHAYEGGHPDHDATAFAVHRACHLLRLRGEPIAVIEMPFYRAGETGDLKQSFSGDQGITVRLTVEEATLKARMLSSHATQRETLQGFRTDGEFFRAAHNYDFSELPNGGRLLYEAQDWNMSADRWLALVRAAGAALEEEAARWR